MSKMQRLNILRKLNTAKLTYLYHKRCKYTFACKSYSETLLTINKQIFIFSKCINNTLNTVKNKLKIHILRTGGEL